MRPFALLLLLLLFVASAPKLSEDALQVAIDDAGKASSTQIDNAGKASSTQMDDAGKASSTQKQTETAAKKKQKKKKRREESHIEQFRREHNAQLEVNRRAEWDLPDEPALFDYNSCAICEAAALQGAAAVVRWHEQEEERLVALKRRPKSAKRPATASRKDVSRLIEDLEASCTDHAKWTRRYRQRVANAGGEFKMVLTGPGIEPLPGKEKAGVASGAKKPKSLPSQFAEFEALQAGGGGGGEDDDEPITEEIVNTLVRDCARPGLSKKARRASGSEALVASLPAVLRRLPCLWLIHRPLPNSLLAICSTCLCSLSRHRRRHLARRLGGGGAAPGRSGGERGGGKLGF